MKDKVILDTNIWFYLYGKVPLDKYNQARKLFIENFYSIIISTQILGELFNSLNRKKVVSTDEAKEIIIEL